MSASAYTNGVCLTPPYFFFFLYMRVRCRLISRRASPACHQLSLNASPRALRVHPHHACSPQRPLYSILFLIQFVYTRPSPSPRRKHAVCNLASRVVLCRNSRGKKQQRVSPVSSGLNDKQRKVPKRTTRKRNQQPAQRLRNTGQPANDFFFLPACILFIM